MNPDEQEILDIFTRTGALLRGHFILRSGLRSGHFFQCAQVCQHMAEVERLGELLAARVADLDFKTVLAPAMGGLVIGQEVARRTKTRYIFAEKVDSKLELRRGFKIAEGERVLVVEDVVTRGGRVVETLDIIKAKGGVPAGVAMLVDRGVDRPDFGVPTISLLALQFPTYQPDALPPELAAIPPIKPGS